MTARERTLEQTLASWVNSGTMDPGQAQAVRVARIARDLTDAQENALFHPKGWHAAATVRALRSRGLLDGDHLTALGLAVRDHLAGKPQ